LLNVSNGGCTTRISVNEAGKENFQMLELMSTKSTLVLWLVVKSINFARGHATCILFYR